MSDPMTSSSYFSIKKIRFSKLSIFFSKNFEEWPGSFMCYDHYKEDSKFQPQCARQQVLGTHPTRDFHGLHSSNVVIKIVRVLSSVTDPKMVVEIAAKNSFLLST